MAKHSSLDSMFPVNPMQKMLGLPPVNPMSLFQEFHLCRWNRLFMAALAILISSLFIVTGKGCQIDWECEGFDTCSDNVCVCFPGDAKVETIDGEAKLMRELKIGDNVAVSHGPKGMLYSSIYAFGHRDATSTAKFLRLEMESPSPRVNSLELTARHFLPTSSIVSKKGIKTLTRHRTDIVMYKEARDVITGDALWSSNHTMHEVTGISEVEEQGLFNPITLTGTILVNGIVSSVHSNWILEDTFRVFGLGSLVPQAYQIILSPARLMYNILGKSYYAKAYELLDYLLLPHQ